jgi:hypothetical protein
MRSFARPLFVNLKTENTLLTNITGSLPSKVEYHICWETIVLAVYSAKSGL